MDAEKLLRRSAMTAALISMAAESEKIFLHGAIRYHLHGPFLWPFIYTSDIAPAMAIGVGCGYLAEAAERGFETVAYGRNQRSDSYPIRRRLLAGALGAVVTLLPVKWGVAMEMSPALKCPAAADHEVFSCQPDPIDAGSIVFGGYVGLAYVLARKRGSSQEASERIEPAVEI